MRKPFSKPEVYNFGNQEEKRTIQMEKQNTQVSKFQMWVYATYGVFQNWGFWVPFLYGQMYMTQFLGVPIATATAILTVAKGIDFCISLVAGGIIQSANLKKGKFLPWMKVLRFIIAGGAILQMAPIGALPMGAKIACVGIGYCMMHGSMNFMSTCQFGIMPMLAGSNMDDRIKMTTLQSQVNAASSIILSFGCLPLITFVGKLAGNPAMGYTIVTCVAPLFLITGVALLSKAVGDRDRPRDPNAPAPKKVTVKDMVAAIFTNDQMRVYMLYQVVNQTGTYVINGMTMYYWSIVMNKMAMYSVVSGISTCAGFVFAMFIPKIGRKLGKKKSIIANFVVLVASKVVMSLFALKSIWFMAAATMLASAGLYLTMAFGVNYYLDIGEYGYYKTGKDFRTLSMSMQNIPMKIAMTLGAAIGGIILTRLNFDHFQGLYATASAAGAAGDFTYMQTAEFQTFISKFIQVYAWAPAIFAAVAIAIFIFGYKITDEDAKFYAAENAKRKAAEAAAAAK